MRGWAPINDVTDGDHALPPTQALILLHEGGPGDQHPIGLEVLALLQVHSHFAVGAQDVVEGQGPGGGWVSQAGAGLVVGAALGVTWLGGGGVC